MEFKLIPPTRVQAQIVCAVITDRLKSQNFEEIIEDLTQDILHFKPSSKSHASYLNDLISLMGKDKYNHLVKNWFRNCYPLMLQKNSVDKDVLFAKGNQIVECIALFWGSMRLGEDMGTAFRDWWNEWNQELDQAFWEWAYELDHDVYYSEEGYPMCM